LSATLVDKSKYNYLLFVSLHRGKVVGKEFNTLKGMVGSLLNSVKAQFIRLPYAFDADTQGLWMNGKQQAVMYQVRLSGDSAESEGVVHAVKKLASDHGAFAGIIKVPTLGAY